MSDGILKSEPEEIWNYYMLLNKVTEYVAEAVKAVRRNYDHLEDRIRREENEVCDRIQQLQTEQRNLEEQLRFVRNIEEVQEIRTRIDAVREKMLGLEDKNWRLIHTLQKAAVCMEDIGGLQKECEKCFSRAKKILNAYLKLVEVERVCEGFKEYKGNAPSGQYGVMQFRGITFYCNNNAFDPDGVDPEGRTNIQRMEQGRAPLGYNGQPVELHHMIQSEKGGIVEVSSDKHREGHRTLHINTSDIPSGISRTSFDVLRVAYWKKRAELIKIERRL